MTDLYNRSRSRSRSPSSNHSLQDDDEGERSNRSGDEDENNRSDDQPNSEDEENRKEQKKKDKKRKSNKPKGPVRRMLISEDMLSGSKGVTKLMESFNDFEFRGKGKEKEDLSRMLNKIEQWVHTLHPKHPFDQCLERIEFLGMKKKPVKTLLKKARMGLLPTYDYENRDIIDDDDDSNMFPFEDETNREVANGLPTQNSPSPSDIPTFDEMLELEEELMSMQNQGTESPGSSHTDNGIPSLEEQVLLEAELTAQLDSVVDNTLENCSSPVDIMPMDLESESGLQSEVTLQLDEVTD